MTLSLVTFLVEKKGKKVHQGEVLVDLVVVLVVLEDLEGQCSKMMTFSVEWEVWETVEDLQVFQLVQAWEEGECLECQNQ